MNSLSDEQQSIVDAPLEPMSVIACAGSGKTRTAVYRVIKMRRNLGEHRGRVALLSFSNVAVDTFRSDFRTLTEGINDIHHERVEIDTMDSFITTSILRPHAYRTMGCDRTPFLVAGTEPFLQNKEFKFWVQPTNGDAFPVQPTDLHKVVVNLRAGKPTFQFRQHGALLTINNGPAVTARLGTVGAYTHDLGRYWSYRVLTEQPRLLQALARRYSHILVDESQDIGSLHQAILVLLSGAGSTISLIGDPHQGIYGFAGADGKFLTGYGQTQGVSSYSLTRNYRSVPAILTIANSLSSRTDTADRQVPETGHGAFFIGYKNAEQEQLVSAFRAAVIAAGLRLENSAVICRGREQVRKLTGNDATIGQGTVKAFAAAAIHRDKRQDYMSAFKAVAGCIASLLVDPPARLVEVITQPARYPESKLLRREIWSFTRNPDTGLPASTLQADTQWHPLLVQRVKALLQRLRDVHGLTPAHTLGNKLAKTKVPNTPLIATTDLATDQDLPVRIDTVHQVKGESLDAVLYLAAKDHVEALLAGVDTEVGRIGYVAVTRARNLFWLGVPHNALQSLRPSLLSRGFQEVGTS
ncbi:UvrD-helicase domain-containing protein [Ottowia sp.]|uniref:UvrD-helicase domain-containing protein n=1 Tax=Ottowia sp. TaxID=1898956 RepID=UPI00345F153E